jgi:4-carboxymuconolactone decarboxylase
MSTAMTQPLLDAETRARGQQTRREVLGESHVSASYQVDALSMPKTELAEFVWSKVWSRPGLDRKYRSVANLAMLTALNRSNELKLHIRGALNNGLTRTEISEVLLQTAMYCGVAAAEDSFRIATEVFREIDAK